MSRYKLLNQTAGRLGREYPPGTPCVYYPEGRIAGGFVGRISGGFSVLTDGSIVTRVERHPGTIPATWIDVRGVPILEGQ